MLLFKKTADLLAHLGALRAKGRTVGFAPTMGALHAGHISLLQKSKLATGATVCSIFVNPTQFNDPADLEKYPRTTASDIELLAAASCDILFLPSANEVYPHGPAPLPLDFGHLAKPMEGAHRPGHFAGMAQVVKRLLDIVRPDQLFMGQKDYQQAAIVRNMLQQLHSPVKLVVCPIVREADGLAMSSRNVRLSASERALAPRIFQVLEFAKANPAKLGPKEMETQALQMLAAPGMVPEYFEIVDGLSLLPVDDFEKVRLAVACVAVRLGEVRLIDNMVLLNNY